MAAMATVFCPSVQTVSLSGAAKTKNGPSIFRKTAFLGEIPNPMVGVSLRKLAAARQGVVSARCTLGGGRLQGRRFPRYDVRSRAGTNMCNGMRSPWGPVMGGSPQGGCKTPATDIYSFLNELMRAPPAGARRGNPWDVEEDKEAWYIRFEVPGFSAKDVKVQVEENNLLSIAAQMPPVAETAERAERFQSRRTRGSFSTRITLPKEVQAEKISAEVKDGLLMVTLPKVIPEQKLPKVISVNVKEAVPETENEGTEGKMQEEVKGADSETSKTRPRESGEEDVLDVELRFFWVALNDGWSLGGFDYCDPSETCSDREPFQTKHL
eukprot:TRINITY_DN1684_c0_g1_i1.p1 TRINITY_DN1684_c0_g1~~TRINITY_DN1684_c0_g1_i1.p1  ORF type:complete len:324 (-),score=52.94 TRINITY_DN1684_c0_g1_i1:320-1291(-)